jgi:hypothetical protein
MFATWAQFYLNPTGPAMWCVTLVAILGAGALSSLSSVSGGAKIWVGLTLPMIMALFCLAAQAMESRSLPLVGSWYFYKNVYAELYIMWIIAWASGIGFTLHAWRTKQRVCRIAAPILVVIYGLLFFAMHETWSDVFELWML